MQNIFSPVDKIFTAYPCNIIVPRLITHYTNDTKYLLLYAQAGKDFYFVSHRGVLS